MMPKGWVETTVDDVANFVSRGRLPVYVTKSDFPVVNQRCIRWIGVDQQYIKFVDPDTKDRWSRDLFLKDNDILWNSTGTGTIGRAALYRGLPPFDVVVVDSHVTIVRAGEAVDPNYLFALIKSPAVQSVIEEMQSGSTNQVELNRSSVLSTPVPLPPLAEQRRIVAKLDALTARLASARAELERVQLLADRLRSTVLSTSFSDPGIRSDPRPLQDVTSCITKGSSPKWQGFEYQPKGILFVRSQNIQWGNLDFKERAFLAPEFNARSSNSIIREGDVLLNIVGASIGRSAVAGSELKGANCNQAVAIIRPIDSRDAKYIMYFLISPKAQSAINDGAVDVARANFSLGQAKSLEIPWLTPEERLGRVEAIDAAFARADRLEAETARAKQLLDRLESAILTKAFRGELVPQDPADEPASVLLDRIRAERAAAPKPKRGRRTASA